MAESKFDENFPISEGQNSPGERVAADDRGDDARPEADLKAGLSQGPEEVEQVAPAEPSTLVQFDLGETPKPEEEKAEEEGDGDPGADLMRELSIPIEVDPEFAPEAFKFDPNDLNIPIKYEPEEGAPKDLKGLVRRLDIPCDSESLKTESTADGLAEPAELPDNKMMTRLRRQASREKLVSRSSLSSMVNGIKAKAEAEGKDMTRLDFKELSNKLDSQIPTALDLGGKVEGVAHKHSKPPGVPMGKLDLREIGYKKYPDYEQAPEARQKKRRGVKPKDTPNGLAPAQFGELPPALSLAEPSPLTVENWAQCENCKKWRRLPMTVDTEKLPDTWVCSLNVWDPVYNSCDVPEEMYPELNLNVAKKLMPSSHGATRGRPPNANKFSNMVANRLDPVDVPGRPLESMYVKEFAERESLTTPTTQNRYYEEPVRKESGRRASKTHFSPVITTQPLMYGEECELVRFRMGRVNENVQHPLKNRVTLYSDSLTSLLATELPHSALFLDNLKKMHVPREDEWYKDEEGNIHMKEPKDIFVREDGNINLGYAYRTGWSHRPEEKSISSSKKEDVLYKMACLNSANDRRDFARMYSRLSSQIPDIGEIERVDALPDFRGRTEGKRLRQQSTTSTTASIQSGQREISHMISKGEVLELLYKFARRQEQALQGYNIEPCNGEGKWDPMERDNRERKEGEKRRLVYCNKYKYINKNLINVIKLKEQLRARAEELRLRERERQQAQLQRERTAEHAEAVNKLKEEHAEAVNKLKEEHAEAIAQNQEEHDELGMDLDHPVEYAPYAELRRQGDDARHRERAEARLERERRAPGMVIGPHAGERPGVLLPSHNHSQPESEDELDREDYSDPNEQDRLEEDQLDSESQFEFHESGSKYEGSDKFEGKFGTDFEGKYSKFEQYGERFEGKRHNYEYEQGYERNYEENFDGKYEESDNFEEKYEESDQNYGSDNYENYDQKYGESYGGNYEERYELEREQDEEDIEENEEELEDEAEVEADDDPEYDPEEDEVYERDVEARRHHASTEFGNHGGGERHVTLAEVGTKNGMAEKGEGKKSHLDYPLPNVKQLSKRYRHGDAHERAKLLAQFSKLNSRSRSLVANYAMLLQPIPDNLALGGQAVSRSRLIKMLSLPIPRRPRRPECERELRLPQYEALSLLSLPIPELGGAGGSTQYVV